MRRLFILFLIVLIPLRGWAGEVMGIRMAMAPNPAPAQMADGMPADCPMHAQASHARADHGAQDHATPAGMDHCTSCGLCLPIAPLAGANVALPVILSHVKPPVVDISFASALLASPLKPPIF